MDGQLLTSVAHAEKRERPVSEYSRCIRTLDYPLVKLHLSAPVPPNH